MFVFCFSEFLEEKRLDALENAFNAWKEFVKQQLHDAMGRFTNRLERETSPRITRQHTLSESFGSGGFPPLRSSSGYFGSLPNVARINSPIPVSPLASSLERRRDSPSSLSPDHTMLMTHHRSFTLDSPHSPPRDDHITLSLNRSHSFNDKPKSPLSFQNTGSLSSKERTPFVVPPLFTDPSQIEDEVGFSIFSPSLSALSS